MSKIKL